MKAVDKELRCKKMVLSDRYKKVDTTVNGDAEKKRKQFGTGPVAERKGGNSHSSVNVDEVRILVQDGMRLKDIARRLGVSKTTVDNYIKKYDLRKS